MVVFTEHNFADKFSLHIFAPDSGYCRVSYLEPKEKCCTILTDFSTMKSGKLPTNSVKKKVICTTFMKKKLANCSAKSVVVVPSMYVSTSHAFQRLSTNRFRFSTNVFTRLTPGQRRRKHLKLDDRNVLPKLFSAHKKLR